MKAIIQISMNNAAFENNPEEELSRILSDLSERLHGQRLYVWNGKRLHDLNGNDVGYFKIIDEEATK